MTDVSAPARLARGDDRSVAPVRIVHLGLGAFHRAHEAWYTDLVDDDAEWGIAAFTGRSPDAALKLAPQGGLYTLLTRSAAGDEARIVRSVVEVVDGAETLRLCELVADPAVAIVSLTITEAGYRLTADAAPDTGDPAVAGDIDSLRALLGGGAAAASTLPTTALGRLALALDGRRRAGMPGLAVVPCDNIPDNGAFTRSGLVGLARAASPELADWIDCEVSFVSTSIDRITPATTEADLESALALTGFADASPVVTEPFSDWVLSGDFPAGRPAWERAGARFVDDIDAFEKRKLWLLNGAHTLLACVGRLRGHATVAEAMADPACRADVERFWGEACRHLPAEGLDLDAYRAALVARFENARIEHRLEQIGRDTTTKLRVRILPTLLAERSAGRDAAGSVLAMAAWVALVLRQGPGEDPRRDLVEAALERPADERVTALLAVVDPALGEPAVVSAVVGAMSGL